MPPNFPHMLSAKPAKRALSHGSKGALSLGAAIFALVLLATPIALHLVCGFQVSPVPDTSMAPTLHAGDLMITVPRKAVLLHQGDIVVIPDITQKNLVAHRIVYLQQQADEIIMATKADASKIVDQGFSRFESSATVPVKVATFPRVGMPVDFFARNKILTAPIFFLMLLFMISVMKAFSRRSQKPTFERPPSARREIRVPRLDDPLNRFVNNDEIGSFTRR